MSLNYKMEIYTINTEDGKEYVAHFPALKELAGGGQSQAEALECLLENAKEYMQWLVEDGYPIPKEGFFDEKHQV